MARSKKSQVTELDTSYWWVYLVQGIFSILVGWLLIAQPAWTVLTLVVLLGLYWLVSGILEIVFSLFDVNKKGSKWGLRLVGGVVALIAGLFVVNNPVFAGVLTPVMLMYIMAFTFIINGIINMVVGSDNDHDGNNEWTWGTFFLGILYLILGIVLLSSPTLVSTASVVMAAALLLIFGGIVSTVVSFKLKGANKK